MESSGFVSVELGGYTAQMCPYRTPSSEETGTLCILKDAMPLPADELIPMASMLRRAPINVSVVVQDVASGGEMRTVAQQQPVHRLLDRLQKSFCFLRIHTSRNKDTGGRAVQGISKGLCNSAIRRILPV